MATNTTTGMRTFTTAKQFAIGICKGRGTDYLARLQAVSLSCRVEVIVQWCESATRSNVSDPIAFGYNPASYGLQHAIITGRINGKADAALRAMTVKQLCEVVHTLLTECGPTIEGYARWLNEHYGR